MLEASARIKICVFLGLLITMDWSDEIYMKIILQFFSAVVGYFSSRPIHTIAACPSASPSRTNRAKPDTLYYLSRGN